jgi:hypothetical protein
MSLVIHPLAVLFCIVLLGGCALSSPDRPLPASHPANPNAPESSLSPASQTLAPSASVRPATASLAAAFVCPMHEQVTSDQPGSCPICHMKLVPSTTNHLQHGGHQ